MLVSVLMDKEADFKAFLSFYEHWQSPLTHNDTRMALMSFRISEDTCYGYMRNSGDGGRNANSATDGDLDAAYALFLASENP